MRTDIKKIFFCASLIVCFSVGCENSILDPRDGNQQTLERVLRDPAYAEGFLHSAYKNLPTNYTFSDVATDDAVSNDKSSGFRRMATGEWSALYSPVSVWDNAYTAIFNLNFLLSVVNDVQWSTQSPTRNALFIEKNSGEAYALRGYFYLQLLMNHGGVGANDQVLGVPLITTPLATTDEWKLPRDSFQKVIDQINADFDKAMTLLPRTWNSSYTDDDMLRVMGVQNQGRIQGKIVEALKAKAALLAASPAYNNGTSPLDKAAIAARLTAPLLKELGGITGLAPKGIVFYDADTDITNPEILWRTNHSTNNTLERDNYPPSLFGNGRVNPTQNLVEAFPMANGYPIDHPLSGYKPGTPYAGRDSRLAANIVTHGSVLLNTTINTSPSSPTLDGLNLTQVSTRTGYYLKKLLRLDVNLNPTATSTRRHFYTHIRYTELFLNYAEAANEAWGPDGDPDGNGFTARTIMAKIRQRAKIDAKDPYLATRTSKELMRDLIRNERRLELCFEGHRFWDVRRWQQNLNVQARGVSIENGVFTPIIVENRVYSSPAAYFGPIPQSEINKNNQLSQNKGW